MNYLNDSNFNTHSTSIINLTDGHILYTVSSYSNKQKIRYMWPDILVKGFPLQYINKVIR